MYEKKYLIVFREAFSSERNYIGLRSSFISMGDRKHNIEEVQKLWIYSYPFKFYKFTDISLQFYLAIISIMAL